MKMLNRIGPCVDSQGTQVVSGLQLDFVPLIPLPWTCLSDSFQPTSLSAHPATHQQLGNTEFFRLEKIFKIFVHV